MSQMENFMLGGTKRETDSPYTQLVSGSDRVQVLDAYGAGEDNGNVRLPDARTLQAGGPQFYIAAIDGFGFGINVYDYGGNLYELIEDTMMAVFVLLDNSTAAGLWVFKKFGTLPG